MAAPMDETENGKTDRLFDKFTEKKPSNGMKNDFAKKCGCKGIRTCLSCEKVEGVQPKFADLDAMREQSYVYCPRCFATYPGWDCLQDDDDCVAHHRSSTERSRPPTDRWPHPDGIYLQQDFINENEEQLLIRRINEIPWVESQSGRRKQDFGPKVNFKKRKVRCSAFLGFPSFVGFLLTRFSEVPCLHDFLPVELCHLNYDPKRGSTIDPHLDDAWLWGERLVTVNLGAPTVLTLTLEGDGGATIALRIPMERRSLLVLSDDARYVWKHAIFREDVKAERFAVTFRELAPEFRTGGAHEELGRELLRRAGDTLQI